MERWGERVMKVHSTWLANSVSCCFPRLQDQPAGEKNVGYDEESWTPSATSSEGHSPIPVSSMTSFAMKTLKVLTRYRVQYYDHRLLTTSSSNSARTSQFALGYRLHRASKLPKDRETLLRMDWRWA